MFHVQISTRNAGTENHDVAAWPDVERLLRDGFERDDNASVIATVSRQLSADRGA